MAGVRENKQEDINGGTYKMTTIDEKIDKYLVNEGFFNKTPEEVYARFEKEIYHPGSIYLGLDDLDKAVKRVFKYKKAFPKALANEIKKITKLEEKRILESIIKYLGGGLIPQGLQMARKKDKDAIYKIMEKGTLKDIMKLAIY
jgi:hypothetical protein